MNVFKFGGTSIGSADAIGRAVEITLKQTGPLVVVVSAMAGVTDMLLAAANAAWRGALPEAQEASTKFRDLHLGASQALLKGDTKREADAETVRLATELDRICESVAALGELTPRTLDLVVSRGERALARMFALILRAQGRKCAYVDGPDVIVVEHKFGAMHADLVACAERGELHIKPQLLSDHIVIVPGYIGRTADRDLVTLGRGGSDFTAAILANALDATMVTLYKEVDGLMTTDPRHVPRARLVRELHYREAAELAYYGAKILHPRTMIPLIEKRIPLSIKNTFRPDAPGTRIAGDVPAGDAPVKALTAIVGQTLVAIEGKGMMGVPGVAGRCFAAMAAAAISVSVISQASSESSICFVVPDAETAHAVSALHATFGDEIRAGLIDGIRTEPGVAVIAVVGLGMRGQPGVAARTFGALARHHTNIIAIAQGSSELNISFVLSAKDVGVSLSALHDEFQLDREHALAARDDRELAVAMLGFGQIGQKLAEQLLSQETFAREQRGVHLRHVAIADRSGVVLDKNGFSGAVLKEHIANKRDGKRLIAGTDVLDTERMRIELEHGLWQLPFARAVVVDTTAEDTWPILMSALRAGFHVVTANKKPLAVKQADFDALLEEAHRRQLFFRYEATVGAGLPVLDTLAKLREAGDRVITVLGCLSGTLGFVTSRLEEGVKFSDAVREAHAAGYTEPDPRDDLSGMDVARKALILARTLGKKLDLDDIHVEPLVPLEGGSPQEFMAGMHVHDQALAERVAACGRDGRTLRYVARIGDAEVRVGLEEVERASSLGSLRGSENQIVIRTRRYDKNPMVVTGPGAGGDVTAAGVVNDVLAIATGRLRRG